MVFLLMGVVSLSIIMYIDPSLSWLGIVLGTIFAMMSTSDILGYKKPILQKVYDLQPIYEPDTYIIVGSRGAITCVHVDDDEYPESVKSFVKFTYNKNVKIVPIEEGLKPIMKKYYVKAKYSPYITFLSHKNEYVFYVPKNNIERWQNVHVK